jgi:hypothetical protein
MCLPHLALYHNRPPIERLPFHGPSRSAGAIRGHRGELQGLTGHITKQGALHLLLHLLELVDSPTFPTEPPPRRSSGVRGCYPLAPATSAAECLPTPPEHPNRPEVSLRWFPYPLPTDPVCHLA